MEGTVRSAYDAALEELSAVEERLGLYFYPIRHHSLACSRHLMHLLDADQPEIILMEAPHDLQHLQEIAASDNTRAPVSLYSYFTDVEGKIDSSKSHYSCFYPLLDYSPELVAIREGKKRGIPVHWIDLAHVDRLKLNSEARPQAINGQHASVYNHDHIKEEEHYFEQIMERSGCKSFHEWWERTFEIEGIRLPTSQFRARMLAFSYHVRSVSGHVKELDLAREAYMVSEIRRFTAGARRTLVLTGGYHTWGIVNGLLEDKESVYHPEVDRFGSESYVMPYGLEDADPKKGYSSGMPYPAYYQLVWDYLQFGTEFPFEKAGIDLLLQTAKRLRRQEEAAATPDLIAALEMSNGLKALRGKREFGLYELRDGVRAAFVKGELTLSNDMPIRILDAYLQGSLRGQLDSIAGVPPLVRDFYDQCKELKLKTNTSVEQQLALQIYTKPRDLRRSRLLHQLSFLTIEFGSLYRGLDVNSRNGMNLMEEHWRTKMSPRVETRLIEQAVYGATVYEAAEAYWIARTRQAATLEELTMLAVIGCRLGHEKALDALLPRLASHIQDESSFLAVSEAIERISFLRGMSDLWKLERILLIESVLDQLLEKGIWLLGSVSTTTVQDENIIIRCMKDLSTRIRAGSRHQPLFHLALASILQDKHANPAIEGAATGLYYGAGSLKAEAAAKSAEGYFYGSRIHQAACYLKGLFLTARDLLLIEPTFLRGITAVISQMSHDQFDSVLPDLKLAFSFFSPQEIDKIARQLAGDDSSLMLHLLNPISVSSETVRLGRQLDEDVKRMMTEWGLQT